MVSRKKHGTGLFWLVLLVGIALFLNQSGLFSTVEMTTSPIQYTNKPVSVVFKTTLDNPSITTLIDDVPYSVTPSITNGTYVFSLQNLSQSGILKIIFTTSNDTQTYLVQLKQPYVAISYEVPDLVKKGDKATLKAKAFNPQNETIDVDSLDLKISYPDSSQRTVFMAKSASGLYEHEFTFDQAGTYQFAFYGYKTGYLPKEYRIATQATDKGSIHPILFVWGGAILIWLILFAVRRFIR